MHLNKTVVWMIAATLMVGCAGETTPEGHDALELGSVGNGKADFAGFALDLPCLSPRGERGDTITMNLSAAGAYRVAVTQPGTPSRSRAWIRIQIDDGDVTETTKSSQSPTTTWTPSHKGSIDYAVTIINRSHTKELCAHVDLQAVAAPTPPTERRAFAPQLAFETGQDKVPVAFFDADSTLRVSRAGSVTPENPDDVMLLPGVAAALKKASESGYLIAVVSNQGGVSRGYTTFDTAEAALSRTAELLAERGATVDYFDFAPEYDGDRKPRAGMATALEANLEQTFGVKIDWDASYMVGDAGWKRGQDVEPGGLDGEDFSNSDRGFAEGLGIPFYHPRDFFGWAELGVRNFHNPTDVELFESAHPGF